MIIACSVLNCMYINILFSLLTPFERPISTELSLACKTSSVGIPSIPGENSISNKNILDLIALNSILVSLLYSRTYMSLKFRFLQTNLTYPNWTVLVVWYCFFYTKSCLRYNIVCSIVRVIVVHFTWTCVMVSLAGRYVVASTPVWGKNLNKLDKFDSICQLRLYTSVNF